MRTQFKNLIYSLTIAAFVLSASSVFAEAGLFKRDCDMKRFQKKLNLSAEQQELMDAHKAKQREGKEVFYQSIKTAREELKAELKKEELNMDAINQIQSELKDLDAKMTDHRLEGILEVKEILNPEQFSDYMDLKEKKRGRKCRKCGSPELSDP